MQDPRLAPVRARPQAETRSRAAPQHGLASVRSGEGASARHGDLRGVAKRSRDSAQSRRLLALGVIYDGRSDAARFAGVGLQIIRDWVLRFNAEGPEGLKNRKPPPTN